MKVKFLSCLCILIVAAAMFAGCGKTAGSGTATSGTSAATFAPTTPAPTPPPTTAGPRKQYLGLTLVDSSTGTRDARKITAPANSVAAVKFTTDFIITDVDYSCPTWNTTGGGCTISLYKWDTDYATTVAGTPVYSETFTDCADNDTQILELPDERAVAGTYLAALSDGVGTIGTWGYKDADLMDDPTAEYFFNGQPSTFYDDVTVNGYSWVDANG